MRKADVASEYKKTKQNHEVSKTGGPRREAHHAPGGLLNKMIAELIVDKDTTSRVWFIVYPRVQSFDT